MLSFWNETLKNLTQDQRKDKFIFIINKTMFEVPLSYALGVSPLITEKYLKDPTFHKFEIEDKEKIEEEFSKFIRGEKIKRNTFVKFGKLLKNKDMIKKWKKSEEITKETVIEYLKNIEDIFYNNDNTHDDNQNNGREMIDIDDIKEEIKYIENHLEEMKEEIKQLREEELIYIIRNKNINIEKEDIIWEIIKKRVKEMKKEIYNKEINKKERDIKRKIRRILLENVKIKYLTEDNFKEYVEEIEACDISINSCHSNKEEDREDKKDEKGNIWNQIQEIILNNKQSNTATEKGKHQQIEHKDGKDFEGIIKYLKDNYGNNLHEQGIITITASPNGNSIKPEQVIDYNFKSYWYNSEDSLGGWWGINFIKKKVKMDGYSIKTANQNTNWAHLKNWVIEGRNEGEEWKEIDRQDNFDLNGYSYQHYYSLQMTEPYQYVRIRCIGRDHWGYQRDKDEFALALSNVEIYGEIKEE